MRQLKKIFVFLLAVFIAPTFATAGWWSMQDRPGTWRSADWSSSGILPASPAVDEAAIYVMAARTGGLKGALSVHSWLVVKRPGTGSYERYDKVGWGSPIRRNAYAADGRWYSNAPRIVHAVKGDEAEKLIPKVEQAIAAYPYSRHGDYRLWPGPNSNSFVGHVLRETPELGAILPPNATGRDFAPGFASFAIASDWRDVHATVGGLFGFAAGARSGFEIHFLGLVAGLDFARPALKIPAFGRVDLLPGA